MASKSPGRSRNTCDLSGETGFIAVLGVVQNHIFRKIPSTVKAGFGGLATWKALLCFEGVNG